MTILYIYCIWEYSYSDNNIRMNQKHEQVEEHPNYSDEGGLVRLHELAESLGQHPSGCDKQLREYTSIYVECHHRTQQFFITLCQHRFIMLLLDNSNNVTEPLCILECLNLLLANTKQSSQLVYILSQNAVHDYLFAPSILNKDTQFIQYYVQLIKTLLMKISEHQQNKSIIRMFCNSKYPNFPLLTYITILAGDQNQLIRVTAQQCILILVGMINQKKIYSIYLSEPPMLVFIVRLATEFLKPGTDHDGICKYFADLMYELKNNRVPLMLISNILCNVIILSSLPNKISIALSFIQLITKSIETRVLEHKGLAIQQSKNQGYYKKKQSKSNKYYQMFEESACDNLVIICSVFYRIIIKYLTNKYINATYLAAYTIICPTLTSEQQVQTSLPLKISYPGIQAQCKILQDYSLKKYIDEQHPVSQIELGSDFNTQIEDAINQYSTSREFLKLKDNYLKKIGNGKSQPSAISIFGRIFNRGSSEQLNTQYIKYISDFASVSFIKGEPVSLNIGKHILPSTCPFISEYLLLSSALRQGLKYDHIKTGQESDSVQANEIHFNDIRSLWCFTLVNLDILSVMTRRFIQFINSQSSEIVTLVVPKLYIPPCYLLLGQLKDYLSTSIHQHINRQPKNAQLVQSMPMLISLSKICSLLNVQLAQTPYISLANQLTSLHQQLQTCLFENGFKDVVDYIKAKNKLSIIELEQKNKLNNNQIDSSSEKLGDKKLGNIKIKVKPSITFLKLCAFECIQKIMDPHIKPLNKHFETKWKQTFKQNPSFYQDLHQQYLSSFKVSYFGKNGCTLNFVKMVTPPTIVLRVQLNNKKLLQNDILDLQGIKRNTIDNRVLQFGGGNVENVKTDTSQMGDQILQRFKQYRFVFEECVTSATLQYLAGTNQTLSLKGKKMRYSYSRKSNDFETPQ